MAVWSDGNKYGVKSGLIFSFPVVCKNGDWQIIDGLDLNDPFYVKKIKTTEEELVNEKNIALEYLKSLK